MEVQVGSVELHAWYLFLEGIPAKLSQTGPTSANYNLLLISKASFVTYCKEVFLVNSYPNFPPTHLQEFEYPL